MTKTEILAPAGSYETMQAAFRAGADAVYLAGQSFGARAFADNLDTQKLIRAIDEAHMRGKKLYLTVNTLLKEHELKGQLIDYLAPLYEAGLDAVIVQDLGVLKVVHECFKGLDIHASTQMTVTDADFASWLSGFGVTRIVPARELSLEEIKIMKQKSGLEIETFVHGALCYCYSGQCLLSSMIGGRSGNRGRCAQPCCLPYELISDKGRLNKNGENYLLSPKDIAALALIPDLVDAGIDSLKIEGRMKKPEYAALVSFLYRKYVDLYAAKGRDGFVVDASDIHDLMDLYNRGGFTEGYYKRHNGRQMMSVLRPNHIGTKAAEVLSVKNKEIRLKALEDLYPGDVLEVIGGSAGDEAAGRGAKGEALKRQKPIRGQAAAPGRRPEMTLKSGAVRGKVLTAAAVLNGIHPGDILYRTRNQKLIDSVSEAYVLSENKEKLYGTLTISKGLPVKMTVEHRGIMASVFGETAAEASNRPLTASEVRARMEKTGNTPYEFEKLDITMDDDVYVSIKGLNTLRRDAIEALDMARQAHYARSMSENQTNTDAAQASVKCSTERSVSVLLGDKDQLETVLNHKSVRLIYMALSEFEGIQHKEALVDAVHSSGKQLYIALPYIFREDIKRLCLPALRAAARAGADGFLVRNIEELIAVRVLDTKLPVVADSSVYTFNSEAKNMLHTWCDVRVTAPLELNERELKRRGCTGDEIVIYGYMPLMISAQCPLKTTGNCLKEGRKNPGTVYLKDRKGERFRTAAFCRYCYSVIYNSKPLQLFDELSKLCDMGFSWARLNLTTETPKQTKTLLDAAAAFIRGEDAKNELETFTKGHFKRGVE